MTRLLRPIEEWPASKYFAGRKIEREPALSLQHPDGRYKSLREIELEAIVRLVDANGGNTVAAKRAAAAALGISLSTVYHRIKNIPRLRVAP